MKLQLFFGLCKAYSSDNWKVSWVKKQLSSSTETVVPHIGYGGYGWNLSIACSNGTNNLKVDLFYKGNLLNTSTLSSRGKCVLVPDGGTIEDYSISIYKDEPKGPARVN